MWTFTQVAGVTVDSRDRVYVLCKREHPLIVFDADGEFIESRGEGLFTRAHGAYIDAEDNLYCVNDGDHTVRKFASDGELILTLGVKGRPAPPGEPFNRPTDAALATNGDLYISDGYANSSVHRFSGDGELIQSWGEPGEGPSQFNLPHGIWVRGGRVYVADRQNCRIQVFTLQGGYVEEWVGLGRPCAIYMDSSGHVFVAELTSRVSVLSPSGEVLARIGSGKGPSPGQFIAPHCIWGDSRDCL